MRKLQLVVPIFVLLLTAFVVAQSNPPSKAAAGSMEIENRINAILSKMTLEEKIDYIGGENIFYIRAVPKAGVPALKMADGPYGIRNYGPSTTLAGGIGLAATWDPRLVRHAGVVLGQDARARGVHFLLAPGVNIYRAPMAGRNFEYFGEDPFLAAQTAVAYIEGVQSKGVSATIKHFMGNNSEYDRHNTDSIINERTMREIYLPTFEAAVKKAHVGAIMDSYNFTNGEHMTQNDYFNTEIARKEWGFDGIMMSDWDATYDGVAAVNGGLDLEMPWGKFMNRETLLPAIKAGKVSEATIDEHVRRILRVALRFGWLDDHQQTDTSISLYNLEGRAVALQAARESMVLLKNDNNLLPLDKNKIKTLAVIGPDAYPGQPVGGGSAGVQPFHAVSFMEGLTGYLGKGVKVFYAPGLASRSAMADATEFVTEIAGGKAGLNAEYFKTKDLSGPSVPAIAQHINRTGDYWRANSNLPPEYHSVRWSGYYIAKDTGTYDVFVEGTGEGSGYRAYIDDNLVVDSWERAELLGYAPVQLSPGAHKVRIEFFRRSANQNIRMGIVNTAAVVREEANKIAEAADAVIVAVGFDPESECEGSDRTFRLPPGQEQLIHDMLAANKRVIVVVTSGGGVDMTAWVDKTPAILQSWYSGQEGGTALAQLLFGEYSPSGKLPVTFDRRWEDNAVFKSYYPNVGDKKIEYTEGIFVGYRHYDKAGLKPLFPFGFGLSYTTFKYGNLAVSPQSASGDVSVSVSFDITNTGTRDGAEIAQMYVSDTHASVPRPVKELKGSARVELKPGETKKVTLTLDRRALSFYDVNTKQWKAEPGEFKVMVGSSSEKIELTGSLTLAK